MVRKVVAGKSVSLAAHLVYERVDRAVTRIFSAELEQKGFAGRLAAQLFRVQTAIRSEEYFDDDLPHPNGATHRGITRAKNAKDDRLDELCDLLENEEHDLEWGCSPTPDGFLISVRAPAGWISFHTTTVCRGPVVSSPNITMCPEKNRQRLFNFCNDVMSRGEKVFDGYVRHSKTESIRESIETAKMLGRMRRPKRKKKKKKKPR